MDNKLLRSSLKSLIRIRGELSHGNVNGSVIRQIDKVVVDLEAVLEGASSRSVSAQEILDILGKIVVLLPGVYDLIKWLRK